MSREKAAMLTQTEHPKTRFRAVFVSLHGDAKRYPGGVTALAHELEMIPAVLADKLSPNIFDKVPTVRELLEVFERTHSVPTANALALLLDRTTMAAALPGKGLSHTDRLVLVVLRQAGRPLRPREIEQKMEAGKASVNVSLQRLEHCRMAVRNALPCPRNTKAFEWSAVR